MSTKLYVGNLAFQTTSEELQSLFAQAGTVESASVVEDRMTGRSRGFAFVDMATGEPALYETRAAVLWDDDNLYIGFWIEEPYPRAKLTQRDSLIFQENDVEVFIDGEDCYYEFEINALGTIYEVFFIWRDAYKRGSRFDIPEFDLLERKALSAAEKP